MSIEVAVLTLLLPPLLVCHLAKLCECRDHDQCGSEAEPVAGFLFADGRCATSLVQHFGDMESLWNHCGICNLKASVAACLSWNLSFARYLQCVQAEICNLQILATSWNYLQFAMHLQHFDTSH